MNVPIIHFAYWCLHQLEIRSPMLSTLSSWICHFTISVPLQTIIWNEMWNQPWILFFLLITLDAWCVGLVAANIMNEVNVCRLPMHVDDSGHSSLPCQFTMWIEIYMFECRRRTKILDNVKHQPPSTNRVATSHSIWCSKHCSRYHYKQRIISVKNAERIFKILTIIC